MVKITAGDLQFPENYVEYMSFGSVMIPNIPEQFIPPLFSDMGNKKRYSYNYIKSCHQIRLEMLKKNRAFAETGTLKRLSKKLEAVYNCIIVDDYSFSFKNNQEMAA
jgi:hypothetical protein